MRLRNDLSVFIVIPTIRNLRFLKKWKDQFQACRIIVIEDNKNKSVDIPKIPVKKIWHYCWKDIKEDFGEKEWIFPRKNSGIRSYAFWKAFKKGADVIITLDDDCYPKEENFVQKHISNLDFKGATDWFSTYPNPKYMYTRGFPYKIRNKIPVMVSHGLWSGSLDLDAKTEVGLINKLNEATYPPIRQLIPFGYYFPMCTMNLAFRREIVPLMYFPLMGEGSDEKKWGYDRYDDIWAGIIVKKILDHLGYGIINGSPFVKHKKKSSPAINLKKERRGLIENEKFWKSVNKVELIGSNIKKLYQNFINKVAWPNTRYFKKLRQAMGIWIDLY